MIDKKEDIKQQEVIFQCCISCKEWQTKKFIDKNHYKPMTLYNVLTTEGKKAKACQNCLPFFTRLIKRKK